MEILTKIRSWAGALADVGVSIAALLIVMEVLGLGNIPFGPASDISVVDNVSAMLASLGSQGLIGLVAIWVLYHIWQKK
tara:strand:+ start:1279 stop:1515 length:237 start_codon:yes stop_codon:yes gene_type:complete